MNDYYIKYVIFECSKLEHPILFDYSIEHREFSHLNIVSAGFCQVSSGAELDG